MGAGDYVRPRTNIAEFGAFRTSSRAPAMGLNYGLGDFFFFDYISGTHRDQTRREQWVQMAQNVWIRVS